jgi:imidazolonepropionase-like amidohydrolase
MTSHSIASGIRAAVLAVALARGVRAQRGTQTPPRDLVIDYVTVIDGSGAAPRDDMRIVVHDGVIAELTPATSTPAHAAAGAQVIDGRGIYAIPGLIDGHVHLAGSTWQERVEQLRHVLAGGVTTVWDLANDARVTSDLARAGATHEVSGPTIYFSALMAGRPFFRDPRVVAVSQGFTLGRAPWAQAVSDATDFRSAVALARGTGPTSLKLYASLDSITVTRATAEAHAQGMRVVAHGTTFPARPMDLVAAGVDMLAHTPYLVWQGSPRTPDWTHRATGDFLGVPADSPIMEQLLRAMHDRNVALNPTLWVFAEALPADSVSRVRTPWMNRVTRRAQELGITIVAGTDNVYDARRDSLPMLHRELELEVAAGLTPMQALISATSSTARVAGDSTRGVIAVGRAADILLLEANPLESISNTRRIRTVIKDGTVVH